MPRIHHRSLLAVCFLVASSAELWAAQPVKLATALETALRTEIVPAYQQGNALLVLQKFSALLPRITEPQVLAMDALLAEDDLPGVGRMIVDSRLALVEQNFADQLPKPHPREALLAVPEFQRRIDETLALRGTHPAFTNPLPAVESFDEYEKLFWDIQALQQRLLNAARTADHGRHLVASMKTGHPRRFLGPAAVV
jgi:hypothetical protein